MSLAIVFKWLSENKQIKGMSIVCWVTKPKVFKSLSICSFSKADCKASNRPAIDKWTLDIEQPSNIKIFTDWEISIPGQN